MNLSAPTLPVFILALALGGLSAAAHYLNLSVPYLSAHTFEGLLAGFVVLLAGNVFKGV